MGRHGPWSDAANVGMVPPAGNKKHRTAYPLQEHLGLGLKKEKKSKSMFKKKRRKKTLKKNKKNQSSKCEEKVEGQTDRCDDCEVWEVAAPSTRVVTENNVTVFQVVYQRFDLRREAQIHPVRSDGLISLVKPP